MANNPGNRFLSIFRWANVRTASNSTRPASNPRRRARSPTRPHDPSRISLTDYNFLCQTLERNAPEAAALMLNVGCKPNCRSTRPSMTPLHLAVKHLYTDIVWMLLEKNADVHAQDPAGRTPLHWAVEKSYTEIVWMLLEGNSDVNVKHPSGLSPLQTAVVHLNEEIVWMLLEKNADVNAKGPGGITALHLAVEQDSLEIVKLLMTRKPGIHVKTSSGVTPFYLAVKKGNASILEELLSHGGRIKSWHSAKNCFLPLHCAAAQGNVPMIELLLRKNADIHSTTRDKRTPLHVAAYEGQDEVVKLLLEKGANVNARDKSGRTALQMAVNQSRLDAVQAILLFRPDMQVESTDNYIYDALYKITSCETRNAIIDALLRHGFTVRPEHLKDPDFLHTAVAKGCRPLVETVLDLDADPNTIDSTQKRRTLLHTAALNKQFDIANLLVAYGAKVGATDIYGNWAVCYAIENDDEDTTTLLTLVSSAVPVTWKMLHIAVKKGYRDIAGLLLNTATNREIVNFGDKGGRTVLHHTVLTEGSKFYKEDTRDVRLQMAEMLVYRGARVDVKDNKGMTPLHCAAANNYHTVVEFLLKRNADIESLTNDRMTPLYFAADNGHKEVVNMLLDNGANINARNHQGATPLHIASRHGHWNIVPVLLERGADIDAKDNDGCTPLHLATLNGFTLVVDDLVNYGADIRLRDKDGRTPLHVAAKHQWTSILEILLDDGADVNDTCDRLMTPLDYAILGATQIPDHPEKTVFRRRENYDHDDDDDYFDPQSYKRSDYGPAYNDNYEYITEDTDTVSEYTNVSSMLQYHIVTIIALGLYVSEENFIAVDLEFEYETLVEECQVEIARMKSKPISDDCNVTFYDFLTKGVHHMWPYARNPSVARVVKSAAFRTKFQCYRYMITQRFREAQEREELLFSSLKCLTVVSGYPLPDLPAMELLSYLSNRDLKYLIKAAAGS